ncbi:MAG: hypothetical protein PHR53_07955, partial [Bacteroidales bacterium]|nr:hypothetical protein [Bacteroidales bacterium]
PDYNPFAATFGAPVRREALNSDKDDPEYLDKLFGKPDETSIYEQVEREVFPSIPEELPFAEEPTTTQHYIQISHRYIVLSFKSDLLLIDRERALERIYFERNMQQLSHQRGDCQKLLFPKTINLSKTEIPLLNELLPDLEKLGFDINAFGNDTFIIHGIPSGVPQDFDVENVIHEIMHQSDQGVVKSNLSINESMALTLARKMASQNKSTIHQQEIDALIETLMATSAPNITPDGKLILKIFNTADLAKLFNE